MENQKPLVQLEAEYVADLATTLNATLHLLKDYKIPENEIKDDLELYRNELDESVGLALDTADQ